MKKGILLLLVGICIITGCKKKDWTCTCSPTNNAYTTVYTGTYKNMKASEAQSACENDLKTHVTAAASYTCGLAMK